jgi:hypothetical protein
MSRRNVLKLLVAGGVTAVGGYALFKYLPDERSSYHQARAR